VKEISFEEIKPGDVIKQYICIPDNFIVFSKYLHPSENDIARVKHFSLERLYAVESGVPFSEAVSEYPQEAETVHPKTSEIEEENKKFREGIEKHVDFGVGGGHQPEKQVNKTFPQPADEARSTNVLPKETVKEGSGITRKDVTIYGSVVALVHREFNAIAAGEKIDAQRVLKIASVIINYVTNVKEEALLHVARGRNTYRLEAHSVNTALLAAVVSISMRIRGIDLLHIVSGALLHDVGIILLAGNSDPGKIKEHPVYGFQYLKSLKAIDPKIVMPSLQHHERVGGKGYPSGITLQEMELSSRITSICDSLDNQISFIKYGNDISIHFTKDEFITWKQDDFDQKIHTAAVTALGSMFKKDSIVILNNGFLAMITQTNARFPLNPVVQIIADSSGTRFPDQQTVDLIRTKDVWISKFMKRTV
jgi:HD-GYP domain-containing protein (c-di-GMP phosphodiesterase class II)